MTADEDRRDYLFPRPRRLVRIARRQVPERLGPTFRALRLHRRRR